MACCQGCSKTGGSCGKKSQMTRGVSRFGMNGSTPIPRGSIGLPDANIVYRATGWPKPPHAGGPGGRGDYRYWVVFQPKVLPLDVVQMFSDYRNYNPVKRSYHGDVGNDDVV